MSRRFVFMGAGGLILIGIGLLVLLADRGSFTSPAVATARSRSTPTSAVEFTTSPPATPTPASTPLSVGTLPPPLSDVVFPTRTVEYPQDWPASLHYPPELRLVQAVSGHPLPESNAINAAMLISEQPPAASTALLLDFFGRQGWDLVERTELDSGGTQFLLRRQAAQAIVTIDISPDDPGHSQILALVGQ